MTGYILFGFPLPVFNFQVGRCQNSSTIHLIESIGLNLNHTHGFHLAALHPLFKETISLLYTTTTELFSLRLRSENLVILSNKFCNLGYSHTLIKQGHLSYTKNQVLVNFGRLQTCILNKGKSVIRPLFNGPEDLSFSYEIVSETISKNQVLNGKAISLIAL